MPLHAQLAAVEGRVLPKTLYGSEFLQLNRGAVVRLNGLQEALLRQLLDLQIRVPRVLLLQEVGITRRLSAIVLRRALGLWARLELLPSDHPCRVVAGVAVEHHRTWSTVMLNEVAELGIPSPREWAGRDVDLSRPTARRIAKNYAREVVDPVLEAREEEWREAELRTYPPRGVGTAADLLNLPIPVASIRAWAQLRL